MKLNKFFILISLLLILVVSMGMVSATEDIKSGITSEDIDNVALNDMSVNDEKIVNLESKNEDSNNSKGLNELRRSIERAESGSTLNLSCDYEYTGELRRILINKPLTINGQGHTIDGKNMARIFNITSSHVVIKNINFVNANAFRWDGPGAAIYINSSARVVDLEIINCNFTNCHAISRNGGAAIYLFKTMNSLIQNCKFVNCSISPMEHNRLGQAIVIDHHYGSYVYVWDCSFVDCRSSYSNYALSNDQGYSNCFRLKNCSFVNCEPAKNASVLPTNSDSTNKQSVKNNVNISVGNMENCGTPLIALLIALISLPIIRRK